MPQLLHFLQVDRQTRIVSDARGEVASERDGESAPDTESAPVVTNGTFQNSSEMVRLYRRTKNVQFNQCIFVNLSGH